MKPNQKYAIDTKLIMLFLKKTLNEKITSIQKAKSGEASMVYIFNTSINKFVIRLSPSSSWQNYEEESHFKARLIQEVGFPTPKTIEVGVNIFSKGSYKYEIVDFLSGTELSC